jgi:hypothetical protein
MSGAIIAAVIPLALLAAGLASIAAGVTILRSFGPRFRVGRLLATTPEVTVGEAAAVATAGPPRYVRISGRIDAEDEFEDDAHRPLVLRRTRLELKDGAQWRAIEDHREVVPFEVREGLDALGIDPDALDDGLVVMPRESIGTAAEVPDRVPEGTPPATPVRLRVEQVSSIEHAVVLGVPRIGPDGTARMSSGLGRPLVLSTLESDEAMRVLAGGDPRRPLAAAVALGAGLVLITLSVVWLVVDAAL